MSRRVRRRLHAIGGAAGRVPEESRPGSQRDTPVAGSAPCPRPGTRRRASDVLPAGRVPVVGVLLSGVDRRPRAVTAAVATAGAVAGVLTGGPVAAAITAVYLGLVAAACLGHRRSRFMARQRTQVLDAIATVAADLRAGSSPSAALAAAVSALGDVTGSGPGGSAAPADRLIARAAARLSAAWQVSEGLGAPLADLLDRVEADLRSAERVRLIAAAQTAGARATTWLLASLPLAGVAVGFSMGVDPVHSLLHTRLGGACAVAALAFQCGGLGCSSWLTRLTMDEVEG
jgi:tight adherence protein B